MTYKEFVAKWNNQYCEVAGSANAKNQCVDLANAYIRDVLGLPIVEWTNAQDFPKKCLPPEYEYIKNSATGFPLQGEIVIWSSPDKVGHIAICDKADVNSLDCFGQNFPLGSKCHIQHHTYTTASKINVIGWLRCKIKEVTISEPEMTTEEANMLKFLKEQGANEGKLREAFGALGDIPKLNKEIDDLKSSLKDMVSRIEQLEADAKANNELIVSYQSQLKTATSRESKLQAELKAMSDEKNTWKNRYESKLQETIDKLSLSQIFAELKRRLLLFIGKK